MEYGGNDEKSKKGKHWRKKKQERDNNKRKTGENRRGLRRERLKQLIQEEGREESGKKVVAITISTLLFYA